MFLIPFETLGSTHLSFDIAQLIGLKVKLLTALKPKPIAGSPTGLNAYLYPCCIALPISGKPAPIKVPSSPNLSLFLNSTAAFFLPVNPFVDSGSTKKVGRPG